MSEALRCESCGAPLEVKGQASHIVRCNYCRTDNALKRATRTVLAHDSREFTVKLRKAIVENFDLDEMRELVFRLNADLPAPYSLEYDNLSGSSDTAKALELVLWCRRRDLLQLLADTVLSVRPSMDLS